MLNLIAHVTSNHCLSAQKKFINCKSVRFSTEEPHAAVLQVLTRAGWKSSNGIKVWILTKHRGGALTLTTSANARLFTKQEKKTCLHSYVFFAVVGGIFFLVSHTKWFPHFNDLLWLLWIYIVLQLWGTTGFTLSNPWVVVAFQNAREIEIPTGANPFCLYF